jgi:hypothetical protein
VTTIDELRAEIRVESRAAGFRRGEVVDQKHIRRRRMQIAVVGLVVFFGVVFTTLRANLWGTNEVEWLDTDLIKSLMITFAGGFIAYVVEKERHLRRLDELGHKEKELHLAAAERIIESAAFGEVEGELHDSLLLEDVLERMLAGAVEVTAARAGTLFLLRDDLTVTVWAKQGELTDANTSLATRVAQAGKPLLLSKSGVPTVANGVRMAAPVRVNDMLIGVIEAEPEDDRSFDAVDLELLDRFCVRSGRALANSCAYEDALMRAMPSAQA